MSATPESTTRGDGPGSEASVDWVALGSAIRKNATVLASSHWAAIRSGVQCGERRPALRLVREEGA